MVYEARHGITAIAAAGAKIAKQLKRKLKKELKLERFLSEPFLAFITRKVKL